MSIGRIIRRIEVYCLSQMKADSALTQGLCSGESSPIFPGLVSCFSGYKKHFLEGVDPRQKHNVPSWLGFELIHFDAESNADWKTAAQLASAEH
jgi:hypothetical protein